MKIVLAAAAAAVLTAIGAAGAPAAGNPPQNTCAPTIEGKAVVGQTLGAGNGCWQGSPTKFSYQWLRCDAKGNGCSQLAGETDKRYEVDKADLGHTLVAYVTATNASGSTGPVNSKPTEVVTPASAPQASTKPTIVGKAVVGEQLVANPPKYAGGATDKLAYQWQRCGSTDESCTAVPGATAQTYGVLKADVGKTLRVQVKATNEFGTALSTSDRTAAVAEAAAPPVKVTTTLVASRDTTICCQSVRLSGTISSNDAGEAVTVLAHEHGDEIAYIAGRAITGAGGDWRLTVRPMVETTYTAQTSTSPSSSLTIGVHPRIGLGVNGNTFTTKVTARDSFGGRIVLFQTRTKSTSWKTARAVVLDLRSQARFKVPLRRGKTFDVRVVMSDAQAGPGYLDGLSHTRRAGGAA